ncbi:MAG: hypothetical protein MUC96_15835 [Myxococcaceae bacterium]|jgi:hypothetical protein|nr:hypothetical protein [Myxococcaceae bacterium]
MSLSALTVALTLTAADGGWCWDELGRLSEADNEWSLAVGPREDFWAATSDKVWRWHDGGFAPIALPLADMRWVRVVSAADRVFVSGKNNLPNGASVFSVHEWVDGGFQQLGQPLGAPLIRYAHTNDDRVVSADGGLVATWTEEVDLRPLGLFTARWDGAQWARARVANLREYDVNPDVTALPDGGLRVAWVDSGRLRLADGWGRHWNRALERPVSEPATTRKKARAARLVGPAWALVAWEPVTRGASGPLDVWYLESGVSRVATFNASFEVDAVSSGLGVALLFTSQDALENDRIQLARVQPDGAVEWLLSDFHLFHGASDATQVALRAQSGDEFLVTWNEHASEGAAVFVRVRRCRSGELARPTPPGARERDGWPLRVDDAAWWVIRETPSEVRSRFRATKQGDLVTWHHGLGTWVRNRSGLWRGNDALLRDCSRGQTPLIHPDDCSMMILERAWLLLQGDAGLP